MFSYEFMRHAFAAAFLVALSSASVGYFLVLRRQSFAGHALGHIGFAGATGAVLIGASPFAGLLAVSIGGGALMGLLGARLADRDVAIGMVLSFALGLGLLFLNYFSSSATQATSLLFGNVLGVDQHTLSMMLLVALITLAALSVIARPLLFASIAPDLAAARGIRTSLVSVLFLAIAGAAVAQAVQVVGVLLVFTLMVGPAACAHKLCARVGSGFCVCVLLAVAQAMGGVALSYISDWPASFCISLLSVGCYLGIEGKEGLLF